MILGDLYKEGRGVKQDLEEAKRWYAKASFENE
jgi:TPR repeat protein